MATVVSNSRGLTAPGGSCRLVAFSHTRLLSFGATSRKLTARGNIKSQFYGASGGEMKGPVAAWGDEAPKIPEQDDSEIFNLAFQTRLRHRFRARQHPRTRATRSTHVAGSGTHQVSMVNSSTLIPP